MLAQCPNQHFKKGGARMKKLGCVLGVVVLSMLLGCAGQQSSAPPTPQPVEASKPAADGKSSQAQLYTAYNIWIVPPRQLHNMSCVNYKYGNNILPAGTPVQKVRNGQEDRPAKEFIGFETVGDKKQFKIYYNPSMHPGKKIDDFKNLMFTKQTFEEMTAGLSQGEIDAIRAGIIIDGMTAKAVLLAYGYPPENRTPSLDNKIWVYWSNTITSFIVCFDDAQKRIGCK
jgi:hypothetical protein